jgi:hypothetical protein
MADADSIKQLEARLTRLEAALAQQPGGGTGGTVGTSPGFISDPAPSPWGGFWRYPHWPHPIVDPAVFHPVVDPAAFPQVAQTRSAAASALRFGPTGGDPPPPDFSRFTKSQLEATLHSINAEKARLASMETMINQQLETLKKQG